MMKFSHKPIDDKLGTLNREAEERDAKRRAKEEGLKYVDLRNEPVEGSALELVSEELSKEADALPFNIDKQKNISIAAYTSKSSQFGKLIHLLEEKKTKPTVYITSKSGLEEARVHYSSVRVEDRDEIVSEIKLSEGVLASKANISSVDAVKEDLGEVNDDLSTTDVLSKLLVDAIVLKSSDIHIESQKDRATIRYRLDGILYEVGSLTEGINRRVVGRLKLLANLKLNIKTEAQDGRFTIRRPKSDVEVRLSIIPSEFGESVVMRLLDPEVINLNLSDLGLRKEDQATILTSIKNPNGMILAVGPTGSGKTTSLYALLKNKQSDETKTITIEDPIEYHLKGIEQTQVNPKEGYTFASGLRSILRQDPDNILIGEIRDPETANTAIDAALTGHLVFSTLHTNSASGAIPRLIDLKIKPGSIAPSINLIVAQRLVRRLCDKCKVPLSEGAPTTTQIENFYKSLPGEAVKSSKQVVYKNVGCRDCIDGFKGRLGIFELLKLEDSFEELIRSNAGEVKIREHARSEGMVYIQEDGVLKALAGQTTLEEVERETGPIKWSDQAVE